jgi:hypothetical protein
MKLYNLLLVLSLVFTLKPWWNWNSFNLFNYFRRNSYKGECLEICNNIKPIWQELNYAKSFKQVYGWELADFNYLIATIKSYENKYEIYNSLYIRCLMLTAGKNLYESKRQRNDIIWDKLNSDEKKLWLIANKKSVVDKMIKYNKIDKQKSNDCRISFDKSIQEIFVKTKLENLFWIHVTKI